MKDHMFTYLPSLISSMKASPACFCREFCHSCEHKSITNSTTELLFLNVVSPVINGNFKKNLSQFILNSIPWQLTTTNPNCKTCKQNIPMVTIH